jgi:hypothetical protein
MRVTGKIVLEAKSQRLLREAAATVEYLLARSTIPEEVCIELSWANDCKPIPDQSKHKT